MMRRGVLRLLGLSPLTIAGRGGTPPQPAGYVPPSLPGQAPGATSKVVRARQVIVSGPNQGLFAYSPSPGLGNLVATAGITSAGFDSFGNAILAGNTVYGVSGGTNIAQSMQSGQLVFYTATSPAGPWSVFGSFLFAFSPANELLVNFGQTEFNGAAVIDGNLTVSGATVSIPNATSISAPLATSINFNTATINVANGNLNLNMADPPNTAAVIAGTATQAQYNACLGGMLNSMKNRQLFA